MPHRYTLCEYETLFYNRKTEVGNRKTENGSRKSENGNRKLAAAVAEAVYVSHLRQGFGGQAHITFHGFNLKTENGKQRTEVGNRRSEDGRRKAENEKQRAEIR